jgi:ABC-2 type transport system ATP-binding protein
LADKAGANMRQLSGGMKRRMLVAQALVHKPPVIVLDEPTAGVDVELRQTLWHFISKLNKQGHTVLLTTHYLEEAEALCGRIAMLKNGRVVALDRTSACSRRPPAMCCASRRCRTCRRPGGAGACHGRIVQLPADSATLEIEQYLAACASRAARAKMSKSARPIWKTCLLTS